MCEKWNSGIGGYICDECSCLLWAGFNGKDSPKERRFIYSYRPEDIVEVGNKVFCRECFEKIKENRHENK